MWALSIWRFYKCLFPRATPLTCSTYFKRNFSRPGNRGSYFLSRVWKWICENRVSGDNAVWGIFCDDLWQQGSACEWQEYRCEWEWGMQMFLAHLYRFEWWTMLLLLLLFVFVLHSSACEVLGTSSSTDSISLMGSVLFFSLFFPYHTLVRPPRGDLAWGCG